MKWLSYDDPEEKYDDKHPYIKFEMILVGELGAFLNLKVTENYLSSEKPEFSVQLLVEESALDVLRNLLSYREEGYTINNPFNSSDPFPDRFDSTSTTDINDRPILAASAFATGDK